MARQTRATQAVIAAGKTFDLLEYDYDPNAASVGLQAAEAMGLSPAMVFKTLMAKVGDKACVAIVPSDGQLNMKALAAAAGGKTAAMLPVPEAERISGYVVGGVSPFGQKKRLPSFVDRSALSLDFIVVNGGQRGLQIKMAPGDLIGALGATVADIAVNKNQEEK